MPLNLEQHRSEVNVWESDRVCVTHDRERWVASFAGCMLMLAGARRRSAAGYLLGAAGCALALWAASTRETRSYRRAQLRAVLPGGAAVGDPVVEASEESFPASDPPSWTPTTGHSGPTRQPAH